MILLTPGQLSIDESGLEELVDRVFFKGIDLLGGLRKLAEYRTLTWLPSLARAAFVIVLREEYLKSEEEIAQFIGLTRNTVRTILRADPELAMRKIENYEDLTPQERRHLKVHVAGGLAKMAYKLVKEGQEAQTLLEFCRAMGQEILSHVHCDAPWAYQVLKHTKGLRYPLLDGEVLAQRLAGLDIKGIDGAQVAKELEYPIVSPAKLLHAIKEYLQKRGVA
ncbi:MAG: bacterio-opsin activator [Nitratiruptor sp.]|nr:bacterio-opsin activator [Nitratiruptor sp.]NPA83660.1 bacterio-opsin activator [Campylobacterota bacterium]